MQPYNLAETMARVLLIRETYEHSKRVEASVAARSGALILDAVVALCHDVLEESTLTRDELAEMVGESAANSVQILTRRKDEEYSSYIQRIIASGDERAMLVKYYDLRDNIARCSGQHGGEINAALAGRYDTAACLIATALVTRGVVRFTEADENEEAR